MIFYCCDRRHRKVKRKRTKMGLDSVMPFVALQLSPMEQESGKLVAMDRHLYLPV